MITRLRSLLGAAFLLAVTQGTLCFGLDFTNITKHLDTAKDVAKMTKGTTGIGPNEERTIGGSVAIEVVSRYGGLVHDEDAMRRLNLIGKALARYSDRPGLEWRFGLLDSGQINAFSAPAGYVFITRGLYELCEEDDQLAAVLAHEIAHITQRHALGIVNRAEFLSGATSIAARQSADVRAVENALSQFDVGIKQIITTLCEQGFDSETEYDADARGDALCSILGYKTGSLYQALQTVQAKAPGTDKVFSTHPPINKRLKKLPKPTQGA